ncbi:MAG TPA: hypothetical protein VFO66_08105 [Gemmatimonadaceae bacterium]|nr:hypothetical protein [Gemmatimonadaceae bacterium]
MQASVGQGQGGAVGGVQVVPAPPAPPGVPGVNVITVGEGADPTQIYQAARNQRREIANQIENLTDQREELAGQLQNIPGSETATRAGLEARIAGIDARIIALDKQMELADAAVSRAAGIPGAIQPPPPPPPQSGPPEEFWVILGMILVPAAFILTIAYARRLWRRGAAVVSAIPQEVYDRFTRVEQSIDSVAVEVERIGEGQRYLTRLLSDKAIGAGAAQPVETKVKEGERVR